MRYIEMHRGPAAYVLGPPPSRSRDLATGLPFDYYTKPDAADRSHRTDVISNLVKTGLGGLTDSKRARRT